MSEEESCPEHQEVAENKERVTTVVLHESKLEKAFRAVCLNGAILSIGLSLAFIGTALPDLQGRTKTGFDDITKIFVARGLGFLVGVICGNYLLRQANQACWITIALVVLAATVIMVPSCVNLAFLMGTLFIQGAACGIIKTGCSFICQNHFFPADVAWGRMLFVSFGIGTFLAPVLLLPFTGISTYETTEVNSLHHRNIPLHLPTALANALPLRSDLIAPHILARKRRNAVNQTLGNITREEVALPQFTADKLSFTSTVKNVDNVDSSTMPSISLEYESRSTDNESIGLINTTVDDSGQIKITPDTNASVALITNESYMIQRLNTTAVLSTYTTKMPKKPMIANGEILNPHRDVADSSKFRDQIRQNLNKPVPDVATPVASSSTRTLQTSAFSTVLVNTSFAGQNFSLYSLGHLSSTPKLNLSDLQNIQALSADAGSLRSKALPFTPFSSSEWSPSPELNTLLPGPNVSNSSPLVESSSQTVSPNPPASVKDSNLQNTTVLVSNTVQSSAVTLLGSTSAPLRPSVVSLDTSPVTVNDTKSSEKPSGLALLWLSKYSYWITAFAVGLMATTFAFYWILCPRVYQARLSLDSDDLSRLTICRFSAVFTAVVFHLLYTGLETSFSILVTSYVVIVLEWSWWFGVLLSLAYWGSFLLGRLCNFVFFCYLRQSVVLFGSLLVCITVTGTAFILFQPGSNAVLHSSNVVIWLLVGTLGFAMSAILPAGVAEIDKFLPRHSEFFQLLGASLGEMMLPPVIGSVMAVYYKVWLAYILLAAFIACIIISMAVRFLVVRSSEVRFSRTSRLLPSSEQDDVEDVIISTNDETELLAKCIHSQTGFPLNGHANGSLPATPSAIQSLMKNINNVKRD